MDLEGPLAEVEFGVAEDEAFPSSSLIKILVLVALLRQAYSGKVSLGGEVVVGFEALVGGSEMLEARELPARVCWMELADGMITVSDNAAADRLDQRVGTDRINAPAGGLGPRRTLLRGEMMDFGAWLRGEENTTSASDMVALMREIWTGSVLTRETRELALRLLLGRRLVSKITVPLPPDARYAHKTGELESVENDAGSLLVPARSFAGAAPVEGDVARAATPVSEALRAPCGVYAGTGGG
jgi:beta-lactamase class A